MKNRGGVVMVNQISDEEICPEEHRDEEHAFASRSTSIPTPPLSPSVDLRSSIRSTRKCQIQPHSARRGLAPCARDLQTAASGIHQAPKSLPAPCLQPRIRSREAALLARPDSHSPTQRESFPSRAQIAPQQLAPPLPA